MIKNYSIRGQLYLNWSNSSNVTIKVNQHNEFVESIDKLLHQLFKIPADTFIHTECEWSGQVIIPGKYQFDSDDIAKMDRILAALVNAAANEAGVTIEGDIHFDADTIGWELRT